METSEKEREKKDKKEGKKKRKGEKIERCLYSPGNSMEPRQGLKERGRSQSWESFVLKKRRC